MNYFSVFTNFTAARRSQLLAQNPQPVEQAKIEQLAELLMQLGCEVENDGDSYNVYLPDESAYVVPAQELFEFFAAEAYSRWAMDAAA